MRRRMLCSLPFSFLAARAATASQSRGRNYISSENGEATYFPQINEKAHRQAAQDLPTAPVVLELNSYNDSRQVWAVTAAPLTTGTKLTPTMWWPEDSSRSLTLGTLTLNQDVPAGKSWLLPTFYRENFLPNGFIAWSLRVVTPDGRESEVKIDSIVGFFRTYVGVQAMLPHVEYSREEKDSDGNIWAIFVGRFLADQPILVDMEGLPVPPEAIRLNASELRVNMSAVPWSELHLYKEFLTGVCQAGWCDSYIHRHTPLEPGTYRLDPRP